MTPHKKEPAQKRAGMGAVFAVHFKHALQHPWLLVCAFAGTIVMQVAALIQPLFLKQFFNTIAGGAPTDSTVHLLQIAIVWIASLALLERAARQFMLWAQSKFDAQIMRKLTMTAFEYLTRHSYDFFSSNFGGSLTHKVNKFSRSFETIADDIVMNFTPTIVYVLGAVSILFYHNKVLGLSLLLWTIGFVIVQRWIVERMKPLRRERAEADTEQTGAIADAIANHSTIQLFAGNTYENKHLRDVSSKWLNKTLRLWSVDNNMWGILGLLMIGINVGLLWGAMFYWKQGLLTVGDFILIQSYLIGTFNNVMGINRQLRHFYDAFADAGEMVEIMLTPHEVADASGAKSLAVSDAKISFNNVSFAFHDRVVLDNLQLTIEHGEKIALVGPSGAGKSTITKLLLRFFDVKGGSIEIDGQNIAEVTQDSLRSAIAFVPQEPILFHRTLMENIRYGRRDASDEEVIEAAKQAHCHKFISQLPLGYNTFVGERGIKLSGGERQRVAIARAILKNAPILVLDEATSSLDSESEALIQDALAVLMQNKTVIVIAHRLSTIMKMDRIIVLEKGAVVAEGSHEELLARGGLYQKLWSIQAGGFLLDNDEEPETPSERMDDAEELTDEHEEMGKELAEEASAK